MSLTTHSLATHERPDYFALEAAAVRLARHYRRAALTTELRRVLVRYGAAATRVAEGPAASVGISIIERVLAQYRAFGVSEDAERLTIRLRELGPRAVAEMKAVTTSTEIPAEEVEQFHEAVTAGTLSDALHHIAVQFLPRKDQRFRSPAVERFRRYRRPRFRTRWFRHACIGNPKRRRKS